MPNHSAAAFVRWFRSATPYIHAFRGRTFVIAFGGEVVADGKFTGLAHDLSLLASLGVRLVLVHGARPQIDAALAERGLGSVYHQGVRITDEAALQCVKQVNGGLRVEIEALLSMGLPNSPMANAAIRVSSGNFVIARPRGVVAGVDMQYSGEVRRVHVEAIRARLDGSDVVLLSPLGYSPTGEVFNLLMEDVAASVATALGAEKLIFLGEESGVTDRRGRLLRELTVSDAEARLASPLGLGEDALRYLPQAARACRGPVARAHLISHRIDGALLLELFTHDGVGSMVARDPLEIIRPADIEDVGGLLQVIEPMEAEGILVRRSRERLEQEIDRFVVLEHDARIAGCAALYPFAGSDAAELACVAVDPAYRNSGAGDRLLRHMENRARGRGIARLFVLTTQAVHWFVERGFAPIEVGRLPAEKQALYNYQRRSKALVKILG